MPKLILRKLFVALLPLLLAHTAAAQVIAPDRFITPSLDLFVELLVEVADRPGTDPRAPQGLGDVLHATHRDTRQVHLHQSFFHGTFPATIPLNDRRLEVGAAKLGDIQLHLACLGLELTLVEAGPAIPSLYRQQISAVLLQ